MARSRITGAVFVNGTTYRKGDEAAFQQYLDGLDPKVREASLKHLSKENQIKGFGSEESAPTLANAEIIRRGPMAGAKPAEVTDLDPTIFARRERSENFDEDDDDDDEGPEGVDRAIERIADQTAVASASAAQRRRGRPPKGAKPVGSGDKQDPKSLSRVVDPDETGVEGLGELLEEVEAEKGEGKAKPRSRARGTKAGAKS